MENRLTFVILFFLLLLGAGYFFKKEQKANITLTLISVPQETPKDDTLFIAGEFNNWTPNDPAYAFKKNKAGYQVSLTGLTSGSQFKITRGSWQTVEANEKCEQISNRTLYFSGTVNMKIRIENWTDLCAQGNQNSVSPNVSIISENFDMPQLGRQRRIWIYLPQEYQNSEKSYPVLYMHDGQNLFDNATSFAGEWSVDEALDSMIRAGFPPLIVVGIDHGSEYRRDEYSPWKNKDHGGGQGEAYGRFLVETLKPFIDQNYRTLASAENTGIMGSSMGGLISQYLAGKYPETFGKVGVFSPAFWFHDSCYTFAKSNQLHERTRFFFLAGGKEYGERDVIESTEKMIEVILRNSFPKQNIQFIADPEGMHNEAFWRKYFPQALVWLYGN